MENTKYNLCILDDDIPVKEYSEFMNDRELINKNNFIHLLKDESKWNDKDLLYFIKNVITKEFNLTGFTSHNFMFNYIDECTFFYPELIIFDWDISGQTTDSKVHLKRILDESNSIIGIFTKADKNNEVLDIINNDFNDYTHRCFIIRKDESDCHIKLISKLQEKKDFFIFRFGNDIKKHATRSIEHILAKLSIYEINNIDNILNMENGNNDLVEFIGEKFKNNLRTMKFENDKDLKEADPSDLIKNNSDENKGYYDLWNYRLYYESKDDLIRKGDILIIDKEVCLVLTPDCELLRFWKKTRGILNIVQLYDLENNKDEIINPYKLSSNTKDLRNIKEITSLSNIIKLPSSPLLFPFIKISGEYKFFLLFPKEITFRYIDMPENIKTIEPIKDREKPLRLNDLKKNGDSKINRIASLSEPFLSAVIEHIYNSLKGFGCPDYPKKIQTELGQKMKGIFND